MMIYFLYNYSKSVEQGVFDGRPADYLFMLIFSGIVCSVCVLFSFSNLRPSIILFIYRIQGLCFAASIPFMLEPMVMAVLYVWSQLNKDTIVSFWFGTRFKVLFNSCYDNSNTDVSIFCAISHLVFIIGDVPSLDSCWIQRNSSRRWNQRAFGNSHWPHLLLPGIQVPSGIFLRILFLCINV